MKLFSRKAIAAVATSVALTTAGLSAPAFAQSSETTTATTTTQAPALSSEGSSTTTEKKDKEKTEDLSSDPDQMTSWIGVFTAIISALSAAFLFIQRING
ncbi:hypothetical protein SAMN06295981_2282 [Corynebacterium pollutisoli]|uniref:Uncharacterized protein n=1 Tax=Corynebacterium pollutisoli TaxID=1610489 RepID=A0A1X7K7R7_9CORY|nr:hypothetical protein [Corynebacterium pollutisoli]SMG36739.1 hypothetical protein SAMN06295981_2282 [Corynebacterium pollutisoli]